MSEAMTIKLLAAFFQDFRATQFLTGMFRIEEESFYNSEFVEIDIVRSDETLAIVIENIAAGYRDNSADIYTNKRFKAPVFKEKIPLNVYDFFDREPGNNPFVDPQFQAAASRKAMREMALLANKIRRSIEFQAAQILQTGAFTYVDSSGNALFTVNFSPKASHLPQVTTSWSDTASDPMVDLEATCKVVYTDTGLRPDRAILGETAMQNLLRNPKAQALLDNRRIDLGGIAPPENMGTGGTYHGVLSVGNYKLELWTYDAMHNDVQTPTSKVSYVDANKVIVMTSQARLVATYGIIPRFANPENRVLPFLPNVQSAERGANFSTFAWLNDDATSINLAIGSRPLLIPVQIDGFACLNTVAP